MADVRITGAEKLERLARQLKAAGEGGKGLRKNMLKEIRTGAKPAVTAVKTSARNLPADSARTTGEGASLRTLTANAVALRTRTKGKQVGVKIVVVASKLPPGKRRVPRLMNRGKWRHPVFNTGEWVEQTSKKGWFSDTLKKRAPDVRKAVMKALKHTANDIKKGL